MKRTVSIKGLREEWNQIPHKVMIGVTEYKNLKHLLLFQGHQNLLFPPKEGRDF